MAGKPLAQQLLGALAPDPARPALTWYDPTGAQRVELSGASLANAVAKTTCLLVTELGLTPAARVELELPAHWQLAVWLLAAWSAGAVPVLVDPDRPDGGPAPAVVVVGPQALATRCRAAFERGADEVVAVSLDPFGRPFDIALPAMVVDHAVAVRTQPDRFPVGGQPLSASALVPAGEREGLSGEQLVVSAGRRHPADGWRPHDRILHAGAVRSAEDVVAALVAPMLAGAGIVWWRNPGPSGLVRTVAAERLTVATAAIDGLPPGVRVLAGAPVSS